MPVCAHLIVILGTCWNLLRFTWALGVLPKPRAPPQYEAGVERSHLLSCTCFCALWSVSRATAPQETGTCSLPKPSLKDKEMCLLQDSLFQPRDHLPYGQSTDFFPLSLTLSPLSPISYTRASGPHCNPDRDWLRQKLWDRANYLNHPRRVPESCLQLSRSCFSFNSKSQENSQGLCKERLNLQNGVKTVCI